MICVRIPTVFSISFKNDKEGKVLAGGRYLRSNRSFDFTEDDRAKIEKEYMEKNIDEENK